MATTTSTTLLDRAALQDGATPSADQVLDLGDALQVELVLTVEQAAEGDAPTLTLKHGPTLETASALDFREPAQIPLSRVGRRWYSPDRHTRYLTWALSGTLDGEATVSVDVLTRG